jgi:hypothetical protein
MLRQWLLIAVLASMLATSSGACYAQTGQLPTAALDAVKSAVLKETGYDRTAVEVTATKVQFVLTITNSQLNDRRHADRDLEATHIVSAIVRAMSDKPEFKSIQAVHVDYVRRESGRGQPELVDGIDFRRSANGTFQRHVT